MAHMTDESFNTEGSSWGYRLVRGGDLLWLCEVYYGGDGNIWGWVENHIIVGENTVAVEDQLALFADALTHPILDYSELPEGKRLLGMTTDEVREHLNELRR